MPKKIVSTELEIVPAGELSTAVKTALKHAGDLVKIDHVSAHAQLAENGRLSFTVHAILTGMLLLAKKQSIAHGKFREFCEKAMVSSEAKKATRGHYEEGDSYRTARRYMALAKRILIQMQTPDVRNKVGCRVQELLKQGETINAGELVATVAKDDPRGLLKVLSALVEGMSLAELTTHLTEAAKDADGDDTEEAKPRPTKSREDGQLDFMDELSGDIAHVEGRLTDPGFLSLPKKDALAYADSLIRAAKKIRAAILGEVETPEN